MAGGDFEIRDFINKELDRRKKRRLTTEQKARKFLGFGGYGDEDDPEAFEMNAGESAGSDSASFNNNPYGNKASAYTDQTANAGSGVSPIPVPASSRRSGRQTLTIKTFDPVRSRFFLGHKSPNGGYIVQHVRANGVIWKVKDGVIGKMEPYRKNFWEAFPVARNTQVGPVDSWITRPEPGTHGDLTTSVSATFYEGATEAHLRAAGMVPRGHPNAVPEAGDSPWSKGGSRPRIAVPPTADAHKIRKIRF